MTRLAYRTLRRALRRARHEDRKAARQYDAEIVAYGLHKGAGLTYLAHTREQAVLANLSDRDRAALLATRHQPQGRLPIGPQTLALHERIRRRPGLGFGLDVNKRVALRRAIAQLDAARANGTLPS